MANEWNAFTQAKIHHSLMRFLQTLAVRVIENGRHISCWRYTKTPQCLQWCSTSLFADTTRGASKVGGVRVAESEWHGVTAAAAVHWPPKCRPSPQCEVLLCCHSPQKPWTRGGVWAPGGLQRSVSAVHSPAGRMLYRWIKRSLYCKESICILVS